MKVSCFHFMRSDIFSDDTFVCCNIMFVIVLDFNILHILCKFGQWLMSSVMSEQHFSKSLILDRGVDLIFRFSRAWQCCNGDTSVIKVWLKFSFCSLLQLVRYDISLILQLLTSRIDRLDKYGIWHKFKKRTSVICNDVNRNYFDNALSIKSISEIIALFM